MTASCQNNICIDQAYDPGFVVSRTKHKMPDFLLCGCAALF
jgi:hypothetical protein